ncbi:hypothetical protein DACRYDRAFT_110647 [Dacryopinax primogenitus]|uniref:Uncharacterized protein n=1 Tax=Dacryopinax primogenitus (strain DJM 731) TaxID=1858805 RepID=M5FTL9_DACPD|nr:uncharacterized protein DACRYDRAFT_110647 [Dacryopinax primogenitus]EJT98749.1 hypothetical protein DACRYDRAFT_110647 [Dacryopinax primogenitus]
MLHGSKGITTIVAEGNATFHRLVWKGVYEGTAAEEVEVEVAEEVLVGDALVGGGVRTVEVELLVSVAESVEESTLDKVLADADCSVLRLVAEVVPSVFEAVTVGEDCAEELEITEEAEELEVVELVMDAGLLVAVFEADAPAEIEDEVEAVELLSVVALEAGVRTVLLGVLGRVVVAGLDADAEDSVLAAELLVVETDEEVAVEETGDENTEEEEDNETESDSDAGDEEEAEVEVSVKGEEVESDEEAGDEEVAEEVEEDTVENPVAEDGVEAEAEVTEREAADDEGEDDDENVRDAGDDEEGNDEEGEDEVERGADEDGGTDEEDSEEEEVGDDSLDDAETAEDEEEGKDDEVSTEPEADETEDEAGGVEDEVRGDEDVAEEDKDDVSEEEVVAGDDAVPVLDTDTAEDEDEVKVEEDAEAVEDCGEVESVDGEPVDEEPVDEEPVDEEPGAADDEDIGEDEVSAEEAERDPELSDDELPADEVGPDMEVGDVTVDVVPDAVTLVAVPETVVVVDEAMTTTEVWLPAEPGLLRTSPSGQLPSGSVGVNWLASNELLQMHSAPPSASAEYSYAPFEQVVGQSRRTALIFSVNLDCDAKGNNAGSGAQPSEVLPDGSVVGPDPEAEVVLEGPALPEETELEVSVADIPVLVSIELPELVNEAVAAEPVSVEPPEPPPEPPPRMPHRIGSSPPRRPPKQSAVELAVALAVSVTRVPVAVMDPVAIVGKAPLCGTESTNTATEITVRAAAIGISGNNLGRIQSVCANALRAF